MLDFYAMEKSSSGTSLIPIDSMMFDQRIILLEGEINSDTANLIWKQILVLNTRSKTKPIKLVINSLGGTIDAGMMLYDCIQGRIAPVELYCKEHAYSMAAILLACGKNGRYILPNSKVMIHEPLISGGLGGSTTSIKEMSDSLIKTREKMNILLANHTGKTLEEIEKATSYDHFFTAEESVEFGLCDEVVDFGKLLEEGCR